MSDQKNNTVKPEAKEAAGGPEQKPAPSEKPAGE